MLYNFNPGVLGLGEHRLQSLSTFCNGVKKLAQFDGRFFWPVFSQYGLIGTFNRDLAKGQIFWPKICSNFLTCYKKCSDFVSGAPPTPGHTG